jgi:hypothetical protein
VADNDPTIFHDKEWIAVDDSEGPYAGTVYTTWTRFVSAADGSYISSPIYIARSTDRGLTWSAPAPVSPDPLASAQGSRPLVDAEGNLYVVYESFVPNSAANQQVVQRSTDGGLTFSAPVVVASVLDTPSPLPSALYRTNSYPAVAVNPRTGAIHVVWSDYGSGASDILVSSSADHGQTWTPPARVNDTPAGSGAQHVFPAVACGQSGVCGASFYSTRNDPNAVLLDIYYASLRLHGAAQVRVGANVRVTDYSSNPNVQFGGSFIGDYTALAIDDWDVAHPVWTDTRNLTSVGTHQQDIFTARVRLEDEGDEH